jgi:hypothetical protein
MRLTRRPVSLKLSERQVNGLADDSLRQGSCKPQPLKGARLAADPDVRVIGGWA